MNVSKENNEIVIRIDENESDLSAKEWGELLDYILYKRSIAKSKAGQEEIDELAREVNRKWWEENKDRFLD